MQDNKKPQKSRLYHQASKLEIIVVIVTIIGTLIQIVSLALEIINYTNLREEQSMEILQKSIPRLNQINYSPD